MVDILVCVSGTADLLQNHWNQRLMRFGLDCNFVVFNYSIHLY
ncbi:MAG: hypothetical protein RLZZ519_2117 [Bacteroidota bacterium]|jgi:hypothetical protein